MIEERVFDLFVPISLEEMGKVRLMNRTDSKFVTDVERVAKLLITAGDSGYMVQQIEGKSNMPYSTCYYDTEDVDMFYQHQRGKKTRQKVRTRIYEGTTEIPFLEIKSKNNRGRTKKKRVLMEDGIDISIYKEFLESNSDYPSNILFPQIENHFYRITLVNNEMTERITIDTMLEFHNLMNGVKESLENLGIVEWKRDGINCRSKLGEILRDLRIHQCGFSKYCMGMAITNPMLKQNRLKQKIRMIEKLTPLSFK